MMPRQQRRCQPAAGRADSLGKPRAQFPGNLI